MFYKVVINNVPLYRSSLIDGVSAHVVHGFSTRLGGVSTLSHTKSLNIAFGLGDDESTVRRNLDIFSRAVSDSALDSASVVMASQIHSTIVRIVNEDNRGEGSIKASGEPCDGFAADRPGIMPIIRVADCVPIILCGTKADGSPVISAVHAGWRGTVSGIADAAVSAMTGLMCEKSTIRAAIGTHIGYCCYEVGDDFVESVEKIRGSEFAARHIRYHNGSLHADLTSMNIEILGESGIAECDIDVSPYCTMCAPDEYFSHRATGGKRGVMGAGLVILP